MAKKPVMRGKELQAAIIDLAHITGWKVAHFQSVLATRKDGSASWRTPVAADGKGFPDLFLVRNERALAIEVKGDGDSLKVEQKAWILALQAAGIQVQIATPRAWREGVIMDLLSRYPREQAAINAHIRPEDDS